MTAKNNMMFDGKYIDDITIEDVHYEENQNDLDRIGY